MATPTAATAGTTPAGTLGSAGTYGRVILTIKSAHNLTDKVRSPRWRGVLPSRDSSGGCPACSASCRRAGRAWCLDSRNPWPLQHLQAFIGKSDPYW